MQRDDSEVFYSIKNKFFTSIGSLRSQLDLPHHLPPIKRLDCAFCVRDFGLDDFVDFAAFRGYYDSDTYGLRVS